MGKGASAKQQVTEYRMSIHMGFCAVADKLKRIVVGDKVAWTGSAETSGPISINQPELFGGLKKEGGLVGTAHLLLGKDDQVLPDDLAARFGLAGDDCPGFRGLTSIFFVGQEGGGFYWSANSPFVQPTKATFERAPKGALNPAKAMIGQNANPAHMIYECMTDTDWGMGAPSYQFNLVKWNAVADTLFDEEFGLSMIWTRQTEIENFVSEILDHVQATLYVNPANGLFEILLLRDDYDIEALDHINPSNARLVSFQRKLWGETTGEIVVTWTNPETEKEETVTHHDLANIVNQGGVVSDSRNYYGIRNAELAARVAARDSRSASAPLALIEVEVDRSQWAALPGSLKRVTWPEYQLDDVIMRVMQVRYGKKGSSKIRLSLMEDIFSLSRPQTVTPPGSESSAPEPPAPIAASRVFTLPTFLAVRELARADATLLTYPEVIAGVLTYQPGNDTTYYELYSEQPLTNGTLEWQSTGIKSLLGMAVTGGALAQEAVSTMSGLPLISMGRGPVVGGLVVIGDGADGEMEFAAIRSRSGSTWTLDRGVLDTVPRYWPSGTRVWFLPLRASIDDTDLRSAGETVEYKLISRTSLGSLPVADAPVISGTLTGRPHLPLRPANVKVNGVGFGEVDATGATSLVVTWANRNRLFEDGQVVKWTDGNVAPEVNQEVLITVYREAGGEMFTVRGLWTETTYTIPLTYVEEETRIFIRVTSLRNGLACLQSHGLWVDNLPVVTTPTAPPASPIVVGTAPPPPGPDPDPTPDPVPPPSDPPPDYPVGDVPWNDEPISAP